MDAVHGVMPPQCIGCCGGLLLGEFCAVVIVNPNYADHLTKL